MLIKLNKKIIILVKGNLVKFEICKYSKMYFRKYNFLILSSQICKVLKLLEKYSRKN